MDSRFVIFRLGYNRSASHRRLNNPTSQVIMNARTGRIPTPYGIMINREI